MMGSFLTKGLIYALGYAYPAYECYKTVERNKPEIEQLRFWCQYWILVAVLTISEKFGDAFVSWLPMYCEAKLAFYIYLWYPRTRGTTYVYDTFFKPYVAKHEMEIDRSLLELRIRAGDIAVEYWRKTAMCAQTRFFDILQFVASQSQPSRSRTAQKPSQPAPVRQPSQPSVSARITALQQPKQPPPAAPQPKQPQQQQAPKQPVSPSKIQAREPLKEPVAAVASPVKGQQSKEQPPKDAEANPPAAASPAPSRTVSAPASSSSASKAKEPEPVNVEVTSKAADLSEPPKEIVLEDAIRVTRGRLRKTRSTATTNASTPTAPTR